MNKRNSNQPALISIVIPIYRGENDIDPMVSELKEVFRGINAKREVPITYEVIFINDGSPDNAWVKIEESAEHNREVRGICLSRNFGKLAAIEAGFHAARGNAVITMDSDREDPPTLIATFIEKWEEGYEVVRTRQIPDNDRGWFKRKTSGLFSTVFNMMCDVKIEPGNHDFSLIDRQFVDEIRALGEKDIYLRAMLYWVGFKSVTLPFNKPKMSESSYNLKRMIGYAWSGLRTFSALPLRIILYVGVLISSLSGLLLLLMATLRWITQTSEFSDIAFLVVFIIFSNGLILSAIGIVALYLNEVHMGILKRPKYIVWKKVNMDE